MSGSGKRTHQRRLAKVARKRRQTRAAELRRQRMKMGLAAGTAALLVVAFGGFFLFKPAAKVTSRPSTTPSVAPTGSPSSKPGTKTGTVTMQGTPPKTVACGASVPPAAGKPKPQFAGPPADTLNTANTYTAVISTSCGTIDVKLDPVNTPIATNNFAFLADKHFYDGIWFHRIVQAFMIQGGDPLGTGAGGPGYQFTTEVNSSIKFGDKPGVIAYANRGPNTNGSQFFITVAPQSFLDTTGPFTAFGTVTKGMRVLLKIAGLPAQTAPTGCAAPTEACRTDQAVYIDSITIKVIKPKPSPSATPSP